MNISLDFIKSFSGTLKKYKSLLPSASILLAALLLFVFTWLFGGKVNQQMQQSLSKASSVRSLMRDVPSKDEPTQINNYLDRLEKDRDAIKILTEQSSRRELLRYNVFPRPGDSSAQVYTQFGKKYRAKIEEQIQNLNASDAPSDAEIRAKAGKQTGSKTKKAGLAGDPRVNALCQSRAEEISVYANPSDFNWYQFWDQYDFKGQDQAIQDCWDSQVSYWIYEDVIETIRKMNGQTGSVQSLPVKRLLGIRFSGPVSIATAQRDIPNYVTESLPSNFLAASPTGRKGGEDVDVVHFAVSVLLEKDSLLPFLRELCTEKAHTYREDYQASGQEKQAVHNQISILQGNFAAIDKKSSDHELYRYGDTAVIRADLVCEYLFNRPAYDSIKPEPIKKRLGQSM